MPVLTVVEVNYPNLRPESRLALFAGLGLALCLLGRPGEDSERGGLLLALLAGMACLWVVVQSEPLFSGWWLGGQSLGDRAGAEHPADVLVGFGGLLLVLEATRRRVGWALPILAALFLLYAWSGASMPSWLMPHKGYGVERIVAQTFLHSQGVFGVALRVMLTYVFLFVVFGALLEATGATGYIVEAARRLFSKSLGGPAKVAICASGLMGSLSGSAVANTATTGTFTIPMMRSAGFPRRIAAGVEAAASSGGALVPPVMGAGAYMMLEIVEPAVTYLEIIRAALLPAILYYLSLFLLVHFTARRVRGTGWGDADSEEAGEKEERGLARFEGLLFLAGLGSLVVFLLAGLSVFRAVSLAALVVVAVAALHRRTRLGPRRVLESLEKASWSGIALIAAAACVGIVIGVVTLTGVGTRLPALILPLAQENLLGALLLIMVSSIILGMGLPSAVCYLLMATLIGPVLGNLGVVPLAAHLFIFYFGMMSMVTPPVALAAFTASSIAGSKLLESAWAAFRFALVGFALPYLFVYRPELLLLGPEGGPPDPLRVFFALLFATAGILPFAAAIAGALWRPLSLPLRATFLAISLLCFVPTPATAGPVSAWNVLGLAALVAALSYEARRGRSTPA